MWGVGNWKDRYEFVNFPINLSDKKAIIDKLRELDNAPGYNLVVLYRGGGSGLEIFDDPDIARAVVGMKTPFVTAIGHAENVPFVQQVADRAFITPNDFGNFLKVAANNYAKEASLLRGYRQREQEHIQKIEELGSYLKSV
jgi:exonuclease VII large subunit